MGESQTELGLNSINPFTGGVDLGKYKMMLIILPTSQGLILRTQAKYMVYAPINANFYIKQFIDSIRW